MFNIKEPNTQDCKCYIPTTVYSGESSYIKPIKWSEFIDDKDKYLDAAEELRDNIDDYDITKVVKD